MKNEKTWKKVWNVIKKMLNLQLIMKDVVV